MSDAQPQRITYHPDTLRIMQEISDEQNERRRLERAMRAAPPGMVQILREIIDQLNACGYECEAGALQDNVAFRLLERLSAQEPNQ